MQLPTIELLHHKESEWSPSYRLLSNQSPPLVPIVWKRNRSSSVLLSSVVWSCHKSTHKHGTQCSSRVLFHTKDAKKSLSAGEKIEDVAGVRTSKPAPAPRPKPPPVAPKPRSSAAPKPVPAGVASSAASNRNSVSTSPATRVQSGSCQARKGDG